jgi:AcrR family transcriptional regulator
MPKAEKKSDTADRILDSAEYLFARQGYSGTSTRQIANMAGISIQTMHYHCGSKQELYNKILERSVIPVTAMINSHIQKMLKLDLTEDAVLEQSINGLIDELFDVLHKNPNFPLLFFRQWLEQDPELRRVEWEQLVPFLRKWVMQVESIVNGDRRLGIDLPLTLISLSMLYWGLFSNRKFISSFLNVDSDSQQYMERLKEHAKEITSRLLSRKADSGGTRSTGK